MNTTPPITIVLVDDHALFRKGLGQLISSDPAFKVVGEASSGLEAMQVVAQALPDLVLLDLNMKGMDGIETLSQLKLAHPQCRCVMLTVSDDEDDLLLALREGADGYLLKDMEPEELCAQLKKVVQGMTVVQDRLTEILKNALINPVSVKTAQADTLTDREREVLACITEGMNNKTISNKLGITVTTVKVHIKNVLRKLHLTSRLEAAVWAHHHQSEKPS
ncbi:MAG TPA: two-component system response regulator NarL [Methylophilaceae bacterium]|nr:two-component system response regulator NarL [Methylophilaceae bacterium]